MTATAEARLIGQLKQRIAELEYELKVAKAETESEVAALMDYYDLTATEARIVRVLANALGGPVTRPAIWESARLDADLRTIDAHIKRVRCKNKDRLPIGTMYGIGYRLTPEVSKAVREVMKGNAESRPRVSYFTENRKLAAKTRRETSEVRT